MGLPGLDAGPVDHAWLDNGHGILSCVAGHAPDAVGSLPVLPTRRRRRHDLLLDVDVGLGQSGSSGDVPPKSE
jgi:hypothetical protein